LKIIGLPVSSTHLFFSLYVPFLSLLPNLKGLDEFPWMIESGMISVDDFLGDQPAVPGFKGLLTSTQL